MLVNRLLKPIYAGLILLMICNSPVCGLSVLCMSESGHMKLETVWSSCCTSAEQSINRDDSSLVADDSECGSCTDISFRLDSAHHFMTSIFSVAQASPVWAPAGFSSVSTTPQAETSLFCFVGLQETSIFSSAFYTHFSSVIRC